MATRTATLHTTLEAIGDVGELPDQKLDITAALDGYTDFTVRSVALSSSAADNGSNTANLDMWLIEKPV